MYRTANLALDLFSLFIFIVILTANLLDKRKKSKTSIFFIVIVINIIFLTLGDISDWLFSGREGKIYHYLMWIGIEVFYISTGFLLNNLINYVHSIIERNGKVSKIFQIIGNIGITYNLLFCFITIFTKQIFYIDANNVYCRGPLYLLTQITEFLYILVVIMIFVYKENTSTREKLFILLFTFTPILGGIIQLFIKGLATLIPSLTMGLLYLYIFVQTEEKIQEHNAVQTVLKNVNDDLYRELEHKNKMIMQDMHTLTRLSEIRRNSSIGHSIRVGNYAREIAYRLDMPEDDQIEAYYAGMLHDLGMLTIPEELELKEGKLTVDEYEIVKLHTIAGYHIVNDMTEYPFLADTVRWHHERYDGTGYPNGLKGDNIPLIARIVTVANAYDAMTSNRPYRKKLSQKQVEEQLRINSGTQFDPDIVQIMIDMIHEDTGFDMQENVKYKDNSILVIDDDILFHDLVENALMDESYSVTCAASGEEAIKLMKLEEFSICLLDIEMPGMNGLEVFNWIIQNRKKIKVIFMTETRSIDTIRKVIEMGACDYLTKPLTFPLLKECIKSVLNED